MDLQTATELFHEAMAHLASGVAVITARRPDGAPCGLAATSVMSYSAAPAVAARVGRPRARAATTPGGLRALRRPHAALGRAGAGATASPTQGDDKFAGLDWRWDDDVPELAGTLAYLRCRRAENFVRYDHTILIGDIEAGGWSTASRLLYARRRMDWLLQPSAGSRSRLASSQSRLAGSNP